MERFAGVWENSPWIAEQAHTAGLTTSQDSAAGLHAAMCKVMRATTDLQKHALINAHPDLAGKLAAAKLLTAESTEEQASAGLDHLTADEKSRFVRLNDAYKARFGFPFIIAVKDNTKASILEAFEARLKNNTDQEFNAALAQIERIARLRLDAVLP